jgi:signal transduction histidine kinase/CheY-like chemotaxis protein
MDATQESVFRLIGTNYLLNKKFRSVLKEFTLWLKISRDAIEVREFNNKVVGVDLVSRMNFRYGQLGKKLDIFERVLDKNKDKAKSHFERNKDLTRVFELIYLTILIVLLIIYISKEVRKLILNYRQILNKNLENVEKMEKASKAKDLFLANMSHEIRTPLGAIIGFADQAYENENLDSDTHSYIAFIRRNSRHLLSLVDDLFDVSKINANKISLINEKFDFYALLEDVENMFLSKLHDKNIKLNVNTSKDVPQYIDSDMTRFRQIILNLLGNAVKFSLSNTQIEIITSFDEDILTMDVIDQGVGIAPETQGDIFQVFTQEDVSHSRKYGGAGLGLSISRKFARLMEGDIVLVSSEKNKGSHFKFTIKLKRISPELIKEAPVEIKQTKSEELDEDNDEDKNKSYDFSQYKILLAEDSKENQVLFKIFLDSAKANLTIVDNGTDAVREALNNDYDLVVLDIQMPGLDGYEAVEIMRKSGYKKTIIALTAHTLMGEKEKCKKAGFDDFLSKPITKRTLLRSISKHLLS